MPTELIEDSQLPAMMPSRLGNANFVTDANYSGFLGGGKKRKAQKTPIAQPTVKGIDETFLEKMKNLYLNVRGDKDAQNDALSNIDTPEGLTIVKEITKRYGTPSTAEQLRAHNIAYKIYSQYSVRESMDCQSLETLIAELDIELENYTKSAGTGTKQRIANRYITILNDIKKDAKKRMNKLQCEVKKSEAERALEEQEALSQIQKAGTATTQSSTTKYAIIGAGIVIVGVVIYAIYKRKK